MKIIPIEIEAIGFPEGRDAIFLDNVQGKNTDTLTLNGELNGTLCSKLNKEVYIPYNITFKNVLKVEVTNVDFHNYFNEETQEENKEVYSSFEEARDSGFLKATNTDRHRHFIFHTYDDVFDIVAESYVININTERPKN